MNYEFPHITHLDEVRAAIVGNDNFFIAERPFGYVVNYRVSNNETFPQVFTAGGSAKMRDEATRNKAILRELRGIIFCPVTQLITRRALNKFFNLGEKEETLLKNLDFTAPHKVYTKIDGSMIIPFETNKGSGNVRWGSKMGCDTDVALAAEEFVKKNKNYQMFADWCIQEGISPIFEYTAPGKHKIVVDYDKPMLTLLTARRMITGDYLCLTQPYLHNMEWSMLDL